MLKSEMSVREAAKTFCVTKSTSSHYVMNFKKKSEPNASFQHKSKIKSRQIFSNEQEIMLVNYLLQAFKHHYDLAVNEVRTLAFQFAAAP